MIKKLRKTVLDVRLIDKERAAKDPIRQIVVSPMHHIGASQYTSL